MFHARCITVRQLCLAAIVGCLAIGSGLTAEVPLANHLAADLLRDAGQRHPQVRSFCERLADGLASGQISVDEAGQLLDLARKTGLMPGEQQTVARPQWDEEQMSRFAAALEALDEPQGPVPPVEPVEPEPQTTSPTPLPQWDLATITAVIRAGDNDSPLMYAAIDRGRSGGVEEGQQLYVIRDDAEVAQLRVIRLDDDMAIAVLLEASWSDDYAGERSLKKDDQVAVSTAVP